LWWLNLHHRFEYVEYMKLSQPEDDCKIMLAKVRFNYISGSLTIKKLFLLIPERFALQPSLTEWSKEESELEFLKSLWGLGNEEE
jgi:hypothetical protein